MEVQASKTFGLTGQEIVRCARLAVAFDLVVYQIGATTENQVLQISRRIRSKQQAPDSGDACKTRQRQTKSYWAGQNARITPYGHDLGTTIEKSIHQE